METAEAVVRGATCGSEWEASRPPRAVRPAPTPRRPPRAVPAPSPRRPHTAAAALGHGPLSFLQTRQPVSGRRARSAGAVSVRGVAGVRVLTPTSNARFV